MRSNGNYAPIATTHYAQCTYNSGVIPDSTTDGQQPPQGWGWAGGFDMAGCVVLYPSIGHLSEGVGVAEKRAGARKKGRVYIEHTPFPQKSRILVTSPSEKSAP